MSLSTNTLSFQELPRLPQSLPVGISHALDGLPLNKKMILFTRHSIRELADNNGFAGYQLPLTDEGRELATRWGDWLTRHSGYQITHSMTSPIGRCVETVELINTGACVTADITQQSLLVEPGSYVVDANKVSKQFMTLGAMAFLNAFLKQELEGTKTPHQGVTDILRLLYDSQPQVSGELAIACSHDTILVVFMAVLMQQPHITQEDWPEMMEGAFLWFEGDTFEDAQVTVHWRQHRIQHDLSALLEKC